MATEAMATVACGFCVNLGLHVRGTFNKGQIALP